MSIKACYFLPLFGLCACVNSPDIQNETLNDRVKACSAGFSEDTRVSLHASLDKAALAGALTPEIKQETKSIIFTQLPESDRLKGYEDYIACVEKDWNHNTQ